jgi:D-alanine-D-alanine ligase
MGSKLKDLNVDLAELPNGSLLGTDPARRSFESVFLAPDAERSLEGRRAETIEIVMAPPLIQSGANRKNIGFELDETLVLKVLSERFRDVAVTQISTRQDLNKLAVRRPDLVFSGVKYFTFGGHDVWLNDFLNLHGIAYIASDRAALDNEHDKVRAKWIIKNANVATADHFSTAPDEHPTPESIPLSFPLFLKPVAGGDSRGVDAASVVHDFESFQRKVLSIHETQRSRVLAETYLSGREYSVGILEDTSDGALRAMPIEIIAAPNRNGDRILDYEMKKQDAEIVEPVTDLAVRAQLGDLATKAFRALGGKSLGRIDIKMNHENVPYFIEANLMPGLREGYFYRSCLLNLDMPYGDMILAIADNGLATRRRNN